MSLPLHEKIARLPEGIREQLNERLLEQQPAQQILDWLNPLPETIVLCQEGDGQPLNEQNLTDWRQGGYREWQRLRELVQETRHMVTWSRQLAKNGGGELSEGAGTILAGHILEMLKSLARAKTEKSASEDDDAGEDRWLKISKAVTDSARALGTLRRVTHSYEQIALGRQALKQRAEVLALYREKYERQVCRQLLDEGLRKKTEEIANTVISYEDKIKAIRDVVFADIDELEKSGRVQALLPP